MVVGVTGGYCSGKSAACAQFVESGYAHVDVDLIGHEVLEERKEEVARVFGDTVVSGGRVRRHALARIVFADAERRKTLEEILHPLMVERTREALDTRANVVIDAALLIEMRLDAFCDFVIGIEVDREVAVRRGMARDGLTREDAKRRVMSQIPLKEKLYSVDKVIENNDTVEEFRRKVGDAIVCLAEKG